MFSDKRDPAVHMCWSDLTDTLASYSIAFDVGALNSHD